MGNHDSALQGHTHNFTPSKSQCRGSSLNSTWVTHEGESLTDFRTHAKGTGICYNVLWGWKFWQASFFFFFLLPFHLPGLALVPWWEPCLTLLYCASTTGSAPRFPADSPCPTHLLQPRPSQAAPCPITPGGNK